MLYFATNNSYKFEEFSRLFKALGVDLRQYRVEVSELQMYDMDALVRDKLIKAYSRIGRPVMVDASGLAMSALKGLPQGLNKQFWDILKDQTCGIATKMRKKEAEVLVHLGLCDGRQIYSVSQRDPGTIAKTPAGVPDFHIDRVFIPSGSAKTLAEMTTVERDAVSHRSKVARKAVELIETTDSLRAAIK